jgi:hypothetical protein
VCGPEFSDLETSVWQVYQDEDFVLIGINFREPIGIVEDFIETFGPTFPILHDVTGEVYMTYSNSGQSPFPLDYIIDQDGIIRYIATEYDPAEIIQTVEELLGLATPPPLTIACLPLGDRFPAGGLLSFEVTFTNNTGIDIPADDYELLVEHFSNTTCNLLAEPVLTHTLSPGVSLQPGPTTVRFDLGPLPDGITGLNPLATKLSSILWDPLPQVTDDCCFSWRISSFPVHREAGPVS